MTFKQGATYEYQSHHTSAVSGSDTNARTRRWTLVNANATVHGRSNVAVYIDSVINGAGGVINVNDTVMLQQAAGTNDVYRYASLLAELDVATQVPLLGSVDLGRDWRHEAKLSSTVGTWLAGEIADTIPNTFGIPGVTGIKVSISDSSVASSAETLTINGTSYETTKATHHIVLKISVLLGVPIPGVPNVPVDVKTETIARATWIAPSLGAIVKEEREAKNIAISYQGSGFNIPIPGYFSIMTRVIASGN